MILYITNVSLSVLFLATTLGSFTFIQAYSQGGGINWGDICRNPFVDKLITESCSSLTTNDGYQLTAEGKHVFACLAGGKSLLRADPTGTALNHAQSLKSTFECDSSEESPHRDYSRNDNHLDQSGDLFDPSQQGINFNWGALCSNPIVDGYISEPCDTLTTNGGYQLTPQGERAIACIAGGALLLADRTGQAFNYAQSLKSTLGCGGNGGGSSDIDYSNNPVDQLGNPLKQFGDLLDPSQGSSGSNQNPLGDLADKFLNPSQGSSGSNQNPLGDLADKLFR